MAADEPIADETPSVDRTPDDLAAARSALDEARRRIGRPRMSAAEGESLESTRIAYEMELAEHRSTTERAHRAELAAKDATIAQQRYEITDLRRRLAESEADAYRLRVGPWGTTERKVTPRPARCRSVRSCRLVAPPPSPRPKPLSSQFTVSEP